MTKQAEDKFTPLNWVYHPIQQVRMLRYNILQDIPINTNLTPKYSENPSIGVVIGTNGSVPYIDLQLHSLININGIKHILIHDDGSNEQVQLIKLINQYNSNGHKVDFYSTGTNMWHKSSVGSIGDQNCFLVGLQWAKSKNLQVLVKFSRRLIPLYNWVQPFKQLILQSDGITFSSYCYKDLFPIRTQLMGMNVKAWTNDYTIGMMKKFIKMQYPVFAQYFMDSMAKVLDHHNFSRRYENWKHQFRTGYIHSGYVHWYDIIGTCRYNEQNRHPNVLWHMYCDQSRYLQQSQKIFGNKYTIDDFKKFTNI